MVVGSRGTSGSRLFALYAVSSLVPVLVLGVVLAFDYRGEAHQRALAQGRAAAALLGQTAISPQLDGRNLTEGLTEAEVADLRRATDVAFFRGQIVNLRLRDWSGRVVYSTDGKIGERPATPDEEIAEAAHGATVARITRLNSDAGDSGARGPEVIQVYAPIKPDTTGQLVGVLEVYLPYAPIAASLKAGLHRLYVTLGLGLMALYLLLAGISWSVNRMLRRQARTNAHLALHDVLTGLPNRALFHDRATVALQAAARDRGGFALVLVDLDRFKEVNDTLGHHNGDALLRLVGDRLVAALRGIDTVARLGGDEFGLVLPGSADEAAAVAALERVRQAVAADVELEGLPLNVEASIGVAFYPAHGDDVDVLLQRADVAMYVAKESTLGTVVYDAEHDHYNPRRLALVGELRRALDRDELVLHYQPKTELATGAVNSVEALVRWRHPSRGLLYPDEFIPVAEQTGLIGPLTEWVLRAAVSQVVAWDDLAPDLGMAVNISARSLHDPDLPDLVLGVLSEYGVPTSRLLLEITETALVTDATRAAVVLARLADAGVRLSLDDFGRGYTSLAYLRRLPVTELKIDKTFVMEMDRSSEDAAIVRSVVELGHNLGLAVTAEGVENASVLSSLTDFGCDTGQGFFLSRPLDADALGNWLRNHAQVPAQR
jgi:diguanylate cyclase (GGDEF)-like protein